MRLRWIGALGALIALVVLTAGATGSAVGAEGEKVKLSKHDRALLAEQRAEGAETTTLLYATKRGSADSVAKAVSALGGTIDYRDDALGYVRMTVPIDQAVAAASVAGVEAVDVDEVIPLPSPRPEAEDAPAVDPPGAGTPTQNPYMPTQDIGAPQFVAANPQADGRGMTVGILDTGIDLLTPELQTAKKDDGQPVRKVSDWVTWTHPLNDNDPTWVVMGTTVKADDGTFTFGGQAYTTPTGYDDGEFKLGVFNERDSRLGGEVGSDVNRDGNPPGSSGLFTIIWDGGDKVWVDTNQNRSFADQQMMERYAKKFDVGVFGTDRPETAVRDTMPFVVQPHKDTNTVNIGIVSAAHGTHVAGIVAGKDFFNGAFDGVAPEARIVSARVCLFIAGCTSHALVEGMIWMAKEAKVDVINMSIGGLPALNDGNNARAILYNRLIDDEKVQMFISAGNSGPGINVVGDPSVATKVMSTAAYVHKDTWKSNYGADAAKTDGMFVFSSRGPREDGGFKPNIAAPGAAVSSIPGWQPGSSVAEAMYALPPGYGMFNGTSMAAPQAAGAAALLLSAAKFYGAEAKPNQLRQALNSSARFIDGYGAHEQGNGLINVGAAWDILKTKEVKTSEYTSTASVNTILSGQLATPHQGPGIYEREGWSIGETGTRTITLGYVSGGERVNLSWKGSDGTFGAVPASVNVKRGAAINVAVGPVTAGVHSAILNVDDPKTAGIDYQVLNTVVAAEEFNTANNFSVTKSGSADRPDRAPQVFFYRVPEGTPAFKVDVTATSGRIRVLRQHPSGLPFDSTTATPYCTAPCSVSRTASNPTPGVWEVAVDASRTSPTAVATFNVTATIQGVDIEPESWTVDPATVGTTYNQLFTFTNEFGPFTGGAVGTPLGSAFADRPTIADLEMQEFTVDIPAGSTSLTARIGNTSDAGADLDLFVFRPNGTLAGVNADGDSEEQVIINNPGNAPGTWTVLVDGFAVPAGTTQYDYLDVFAHSSFGTVSITDPPAPRPSGSSWQATASTTPLAKPAPGRFLQGFVRITSGSSILGSAEVQLKNVGP